MRSSAVTQQEVAYYFVALVLGLVNGMGLDDRWLAVMINVLLLATMLVVDSRRLRDRARRMDVCGHADDAARWPTWPAGWPVWSGSTRRAASTCARAGPAGAAAAATLDVVHAAALVADLERRLAGGYCATGSPTSTTSATRWTSTSATASGRGRPSCASPGRSPMGRAPTGVSRTSVMSAPVLNARSRRSGPPRPSGR